MKPNTSMLNVIYLTICLALSTTLILLLLGIPVAWWLARQRAWWSNLVSALISLPLVLPPTVLGFYLLIILNPTSILSQFLALFDIPSLAFTFEGLVLGSVIYSLPFMVNPIKAAFESLGPKPIETASTLGASPLDAFVTIALPSSMPGILTGIILTFTHTIGEFGVVLMVGGGIPGETKVLSTTIYEYVENLEWTNAHLLASGMVIFSFLILYLSNNLQRKYYRQ